MADLNGHLFDPDGDITANHPGYAHRDAPDTERAAAAAIAPRSGTQRAKVLLALDASTGMTDDELAKATGLYLYSAAPRRKELADRKLVCDGGERRSTRRGHGAIVWVVTGHGHSVASQLRDG